MFASAFIAAGLTLASSAQVTEAFACSWVETPDDDPFFMDTVELVAERTRTGSDEVWSLHWADGRLVIGPALSLGAVELGERLLIEWTENSEKKQAFVSHLPEYDVGREMVLITFDAASPEQPPGFVCLTAPPEEITE